MGEVRDERSCALECLGFMGRAGAVEEVSYIFVRSGSSKTNNGCHSVGDTEDVLKNWAGGCIVLVAEKTGETCSRLVQVKTGEAGRE